MTTDYGLWSLKLKNSSNKQIEKPKKIKLNVWLIFTFQRILWELLRFSRTFGRTFQARLLRSCTASVPPSWWSIDRRRERLIPRRRLVRHSTPNPFFFSFLWDSVVEFYLLYVVGGENEIHLFGHYASMWGRKWYSYC